MDNFHTMISRQGEDGTQAILENWEKHAGFRQIGDMTLEARWDRFLRATDDTLQLAA